MPLPAHICTQARFIDLRRGSGYPRVRREAGPLGALVSAPGAPANLRVPSFGSCRRPAGARVLSCHTRPPCAFSRVRVVDAPSPLLGKPSMASRVPLRAVPRVRAVDAPSPNAFTRPLAAQRSAESAADRLRFSRRGGPSPCACHAAERPDDGCPPSMIGPGPIMQLVCVFWGARTPRRCQRRGGAGGGSESSEPDPSRHNRRFRRGSLLRAAPGL